MNRILLVDDDEELSGMLGEYLRAEGFQVGFASDGVQGAETALAGGWDLVVLDVMMPRLSGVEVLRRLRAEGQLPVLMLTARGDDVDRIVGLELGADDYLPKPCNPRELVARIRAILRRVGEGKGQRQVVAPLRAGGLEVWPARRQVSLDGKVVDLTGSEFNLLLVLARRMGEVVGKSELSEEGLGRPLARFDRSIDMHVSAIRQKLGPLPDGRSRIQTVRGLGYQLVVG